MCYVAGILTRNEQQELIAWLNKANVHAMDSNKSIIRFSLYAIVELFDGINVSDALEKVKSAISEGGNLL